MDFSDRIKNLSQRIAQQSGHIRTEEATKNALVLPFINALGYNVFDPTEVVPEFTADVGTKKGEKVDYAIFQDGKPIVLFECKTLGTDLSQVHFSQLFRYFHVTEARIAILTNGVEYRFFTDLEAPNKRDEKPFVIFDLMHPENELLNELKKLAKESFDIEQMLSSASELKYTRELKRILASELAAPSEELVKFLTARVYSGRLTQAVKEQFTSVVKRAFGQFINDRVTDRLQSALSSSSEDEFSTGQAAVAVEEVVMEEEKDNGIMTTEEELEGYHIVKAILREVVAPQRIMHRDTKSYMGILLDDNNRKPLCRLHFNSDTVKYVTLFNEKREAERVDIQSVDDLYQFSDRLKAVIKAYEA